MRRAADAASLALSLLWPPAALGAQAGPPAPHVLEDRLARAIAAVPADSFLPILIEWEAPDAAGLAPPTAGPAAQRAALARALRSRAAEARAFLESRGADARYRETVPLWIATASAAEATPEAIEALAAAPSVRRVYLDELIAVQGLEPPPAPPPPPAFVPWGVETVGAPLLWQAGITGKGRVVAFIDSGVDGRHPLLAARWRGRSRSPREAWFDPWARSAEPTDDIGHGTSVATVAVGALAEGDTLIAGGDTLVAASGVDLVSGVAPEAEWIAANAFERFAGQDYTRRSILLQAMQWMLDPDGDPETTDDIPDVVNNSWGEIPADEAEFCTGLYHRAIDAVERAGVAVIFAAGNGAPDQPMVPPGNRADLLTNAFAVGAVQPSGDSVAVAGFSLGGPSPCGDGTSVKPEVVAPGVVPAFARASDDRVIQGIQVAGTSYSAPHAAGAVALLRQASPFVSSADAKRALLETARDLYPPGIDNRSGYGLIDVLAAADRVGTALPALLRVRGWEPVPEVGTFFTLANVGGAPLAAGTIELRPRPRPGQVPLDFGPPRPLPALGPGEEARVGPYDVPSVSSAGALSVELVVESGGRTIRIPLVLHPKTAVAGGIVLRDGAVSFGLDGGGRYGRVAAFPGFTVGGDDPLTAGALWLAAGDRLSDGAYADVQGRPGNKTGPAATEADWQPRSRFLASTNLSVHELDDAQALRPVGAALEERARVVSVGDTAAYAILEIRLLDAPGAFHLALFADWDFNRDTVYWSPSMGALVARSSTTPGTWAALATTAPVAGAFAVPLGRRDPASGTYVPGTGVLSGGFEDAQKLAVLGGGARSASDGSVDDWAALLAVGPVLKGAGVGPAVPFVLAIAPSEPALAAALAEARSTLPSGPLLAGDRLTARAPFPNPFNPLRASLIRFPFEAGPLLRQAGREAILEIFTASGRPVYRQRQPLDSQAALQPFEWDGRADDGSLVASGVYVYRIRAGDRVARGKFLVFK